MKKILTAAAALLLSVAMFAQTNDAPPPAAGGPPQEMRQRAPMSPEQRAKRETESMNSLMPLGDAYQKVLDVNTQAASKRESIMGGARKSDMTDDQHMQMKQLNHDHEEQLKAAMGPDMFRQYKEAEKARREARKNGGAAPQGPPPSGGDGGQH